MIGCTLAAIMGLIVAQIATIGSDRRYKKRQKIKAERKRLGKKWYDD